MATSVPIGSAPRQTLAEVAASAGTEKLREAFPPAMLGKQPRGEAKEGEKTHCTVCGGFHRRAAVHLEYVGHAAVTARLLDVDPLWSWKPVSSGPDGLPLFDVDARGKRVGLWISLTVKGVSRLGYGSCPPDQFDAEKVLIGDAIRNAAMRFGVALDLWIKGSPELPADGPRTAPLAAVPSPPKPLSATNVAKFLARCAEAGCDANDIDAIVSLATDGRTGDPNQVYADEVSVLRAAMDSWQTDHTPPESAA